MESFMKTPVPEEQTENTTGVDPVRRMFLAALGTSAAMAALSAGEKARAQDAQDGESETFNAFNRMREFKGNELSGKPWVAPKLGNFDLEDPVENNLAKLKMTNNLVGSRTYIPMIVRMHLAREEQPGGLLFGIAGMFTWQLQETDPEEYPDVPEGTIASRSMYTSRYLDPDTMEPAERLKNPYNGKMMEIQDNIFAENFLIFPKGGGRFVEEPQFANDDPDRPKLSLFKKWGDELVLFLGGVYSKPGNHQPRFTENIWRSNYDDVMNPDKGLIDMNYSFAGANKAFEKPWAGYTEADSDLLIDLAVGKKVHSVDDIPDYHKRVLLEKYPDRI
jgi:hypothetical protein